MEALLKFKKMDDLQVIYDVLTERGEEISLDNAAFVLAIGLRNRPDAWTITAEELPELWAKFAEARATVPSR